MKILVKKLKLKVISLYVGTSIGDKIAFVAMEPASVTSI